MTVVDVERDEAVQRPEGPRERVTLREVRETAFRAIVAAGAAAGEAAFAAGQVVDVELRYGSGVAGLVADLEPPWSRGAVPLSTTEHAGWRLVELDVSGRASALRCGALAVDLAAGLPPRHAVVMPGILDPWRFLEHPLREAARANDRQLALREQQPDGRTRHQVSDGTLVTSVAAAGLESQLPPLAGRPGLVVFQVDAAGLTRDTDDDANRSRRASAARDGLWVDARAWMHLYAASRAYLVP